MSQIALKTPFSDSRRSVDAFSYLGGAPRTHIDAPTSLWKMIDVDHFSSKIQLFWEKPLFNEKPWYFSYRNFTASRPLFLEAEAHKVCKIYLFYLNFLKIKFSSAWNALLHLFLRLKGAVVALFKRFWGAKSPKYRFFDWISNDRKWHLDVPNCSKNTFFGL